MKKVPPTSNKSDIVRVDKNREDFMLGDKKRTMKENVKKIANCFKDIELLRDNL